MKLLNLTTIPILGIPFTLIITANAFAQADAYSGVTESMVLFLENCAVCHGENLEGAVQGTPLGGELRHGDSMGAITSSISGGYETAGMPAWENVFSTAQIRNIRRRAFPGRAEAYPPWHVQLPPPRKTAYLWLPSRWLEGWQAGST